MNNLRLNNLLLLVLLGASAVAQVATPPTPVVAPVIPQTAAPSVIYVMRHAEKPLEGDRSPDLTATGYKRAALLPDLFVGPAARLRRPDVLFATARSKHSDRPVETITPLAAALKLPLNHDFEDHETASLGHELLSGKYAGKVVLVCWHHGEIDHLEEALGLPGQARWKDDVFNQILKIEYLDGHANLTVVPQNLLPGDAAP